MTKYRNHVFSWNKKKRMFTVRTTLPYEIVLKHFQAIAENVDDQIKYIGPYANRPNMILSKQIEDHLKVKYLPNVFTEIL